MSESKTTVQPSAGISGQADSDLRVRLLELVKAGGYLQSRVIQTNGADCMDNFDHELRCARSALAACQPVGDVELRKALEQIERWELPETGETWPSGGAVSYEAAHGSNGVRDYIRSVARQALAYAQPAAVPGDTFQAGVSKWMGKCFLPSLYSNTTERGDRLLEEVLELLQSNGYDRTRVATLVDYVYSRPVGEPAQEVGGVMVTLAGYCWVAGLDMHAEGARELQRITQPDVMANIRRKQEAKNALHFDTPLPGLATHPQPAAAHATQQGRLPHGIRLLEIPQRNNLDPINVFVQDYELGRGRIVVTCYGQAWCGFWGAMGDRTVMEFVASCNADYVAGNMLSGRHEYPKKREKAYVERIAAEVIAEFRTLINKHAEPAAAKDGEA
ncbi:hypothetical protein [Xanthomonas euroxanthea]|uniref:hypothetical protein n=1 Tax=Xanthomonas euroxanthea TaxID=2259622 RepID=UPI0016217A96|nr:hypothetical protein [Xanthomonas euroxanthea]MBB5769132.1 hypothetical protein [Xanthomonas euroxanthea]